MKVIIFGATGMVGQGVLRECLLDDEISSLLTVGRTTTGFASPKLLEIQHSDLLDYGPIESWLADFDACFFCLSISSAGLNEADYDGYTASACSGVQLARYIGGKWTQIGRRRLLAWGGHALPQRSLAARR
jgi:uncharacterized protein YbjT (DUF2867 family)